MIISLITCHVWTWTQVLQKQKLPISTKRQAFGQYFWLNEVLPQLIEVGAPGGSYFKPSSEVLFLGARMKNRPKKIVHSCFSPPAKIFMWWIFWRVIFVSFVPFRCFVAVVAPHEARRAWKELQSLAVGKWLPNRSPVFCTVLLCYGSPPTCPIRKPRDTSTFPGAMEKSSINLLLNKGRLP